jgi:hypothetical protein
MARDKGKRRAVRLMRAGGQLAVIGLAVVVGLVARDSLLSGALMFLACAVVAVGMALSAFAGYILGMVAAKPASKPAGPEVRRPRRPVAEA